MAKDKLRIIFRGTPGFALPLLEASINAGQVAAVITQPDRPGGRKRQIIIPPVKLLAIKRNMKVYQPENVSHPESLKIIKELKPELIIVAAYGGILKSELLKLPPLGCINIHPSLLPACRGPCPIEWTLIKGETVTGISCIYMDEGIDTGNIIMQKKLDIPIFDTTGTLRDKLSKLGAGVLTEVLYKMEKGELKSYPQEGTSTYAPMLKRKDRIIDWTKSAAEIHNLVRALNPHPGARAYPEGRTNGLIIWETEISSPTETVKVPGKVIRASKDGIIVSAGKGCLLVKCVQPEGKKKQTASEYIRGSNIEKF